MKTKEKDETRLARAAFILKAVAHPVRLRIISLLGEQEELSVGTLCEKVDCEQSAVSHHLINMKLKGLLVSRREGKQVLYSLRDHELLKIIDCVESCECNFLE